MFNRLDTKLNLSMAYHPQTDGQTKRVNQVLEDMLRAYVSKKQKNWEDYSPILEFAYYSAKHVTTRFSPFTLMYGYQPRSLITVGLVMEGIPQAKDFLNKNFDMFRVARQNVKQAQDKYKKYADEHCRLISFQEGEKVFLKVLEHSVSMKTGLVAKLSPRYCGPLTIFNKVGQVAYK